MAPLIGAPVEPTPDRSASRHATGSNSMLSDVARAANFQELLLSNRRPSNASQLPFRRPSDASGFGPPPTRSNSHDVATCRLAQGRMSDASSLASGSAHDMNSRPSLALLGGTVRRPSDSGSVLMLRGGDDNSSGRRPSLPLGERQVTQGSSDQEESSEGSGDSSDEEQQQQLQSARANASTVSASIDEHPAQNRVDAVWSLAPQSGSAGDGTARKLDRVRSSLRMRQSLGLDSSGKRGARCIIMPGSPFKLTWDALVIFVTIVSALLVPMGLVYVQDASRRHNWLDSGVVGAFLQVADLVYFLDVLTTFRTAYFRDNRIVDNPRRIMASYARSWLVLDLVTCCPVLLLPAETVLILRILKLARIIRVWHALERLQKEVRGWPIVLMKVFLLIYMPTHFLACLWRVVYRADVAAVGGDDPAAGLESSVWKCYVRDICWVILTMTTLGYDGTPIGFAGICFATVVSYFSPLLNGCIISVLTHVMNRLFDDEVQTKVYEASRFMQKRNVPQELRRRVEHNLRCRLSQEHHLALAPTLLNKLSPSMQRELTLELLSSTVLNFPLFRGAPDPFIADIAQAHRWVQCNSGDLIVEAGQLEQEVVFIVMGRLVVFTKQQQGYMGSEWSGDTENLHEEEEISAGAWFGEACLFSDGVVRSATVFAQDESELAVLKAHDFHKIVKQYPMLLQRHNSILGQIQVGKLSLSDLSYHPLKEEVPRSKRLWSFLSPFSKAAKTAPAADDMDGVCPEG